MRGIRWGLVLGGGLLTEVGIAALVFPVRFLAGEEAFLASVPPACLVMAVAFGWWAAARVPTRAVLHGALVGVAAAVIYIVLTIGQALPASFLVAHVLKVIGGTAGGAIAARRVAAASRG